MDCSGSWSLLMTILTYPLSPLSDLEGAKDQIASLLGVLNGCVQSVPQGFLVGTEMPE